VGPEQKEGALFAGGKYHNLTKKKKEKKKADSAPFIAEKKRSLIRGRPGKDGPQDPVITALSCPRSQDQREKEGFQKKKKTRKSKRREQRRVILPNKTKGSRHASSFEKGKRQKKNT